MLGRRRSELQEVDGGSGHRGQHCCGIESGGSPAPDTEHERGPLEQLVFQGRQDKRVIYAAALAALRKYSIEHTEAFETTARIAVGAVELVAPNKVWWPTHVVLTQMCTDAAPADKAWERDEAWERMVQQMRDDLGWRPTSPEPSNGQPR
jgi:hypothetical protein